MKFEYHNPVNSRYLEELGIGYVAFLPLANGLLSGRYDKHSQFDRLTIIEV